MRALCESLECDESAALPIANREAISLTPNFSWVSARLRGHFNRFNGLRLHSLGIWRIQAGRHPRKTTEAVKFFFPALSTQLKLGVNERLRPQGEFQRT